MNLQPFRFSFDGPQRESIIGTDLRFSGHSGESISGTDLRFSTVFDPSVGLGGSGAIHETPQVFQPEQALQRPLQCAAAPAASSQVKSSFQSAFTFGTQLPSVFEVVDDEEEVLDLPGSSSGETLTNPRDVSLDSLSQHMDPRAPTSENN